MDVYELDAYFQRFTPHQKKLVQALYDHSGKWLTRAKLARAISKRRLTPYDIDCLKLLTDKGLIETSTRPTTAPGSDFAYIYNMPDRVADLIAQWADFRDERNRQRRPVDLVSE